MHLLPEHRGLAASITAQHRLLSPPPTPPPAPLSTSLVADLAAAQGAQVDAHRLTGRGPASSQGLAATWLVRHAGDSHRRLYTRGAAPLMKAPRRPVSVLAAAQPGWNQSELDPP